MIEACIKGDGSMHYLELMAKYTGNGNVDAEAGSNLNKSLLLLFDKFIRMLKAFLDICKN